MAFAEKIRDTARLEKMFRILKVMPGLLWIWVRWTLMAVGSDKRVVWERMTVMVEPWI